MYNTENLLCDLKTILTFMNCLCLSRNMIYKSVTSSVIWGVGVGSTAYMYLYTQDFQKFVNMPSHTINISLVFERKNSDLLH